MSPFIEQEYSVPGKVFILGEYAVLGGLPALLATVGPRFHFQSAAPVGPGSSESSENTAPVAPSSPAGRLIHWATLRGWPGIGLRFVDPYKGTGGFGASTAEFAALYRCYLGYLDKGALNDRANTTPRLDWLSPWCLYRELTCGEALPPSGADLVAQWEGGILWFDSVARTCIQVADNLDGDRFLVFSASYQSGRKVRTHEHLLDLSRRGYFDSTGRLGNSEYRQFQALLIKAAQFIRQRDTQGLGQSLNEWADLLSDFGLEVPATREDRGFFLGIEGVIGVKGTGALQSDAILVLLDSQVSDSEKEKIIRRSQDRGLVLISDGIGPQEGIKCLR